MNKRAERQLFADDLMIGQLFVGQAGAVSPRQARSRPRLGTGQINALVGMHRLVLWFSMARLDWVKAPVTWRLFYEQ
jgi:hypothetical protein